ncbi:hypothetical protein [Litorimonas sp. WD9-15]|uniref:hypothetical protein n=1 Tax=Litorimonas sp. WD9-15 TaxID=3418716 RepID=UPI003D03CBF9
MAFFKKKSQTPDSETDRKAQAVAADRQAKWDELERLVASADTPPEPDTTPPSEEKTTPQPTETASRNFEPMDLPTIPVPTGLRADIPKTAESIDVTPTAPEIQRVAMVPSDHFKPADSEDYVAPPPPVSRSDRADLGSMRLDVARISADIQSGEELYRRAQQRIENLTGFVERAEVDFSLLSRLEPENRRLKARNRTVERDLDAQAKKIEVLREDLEDHERRLAEKSRLYEATRSKLTTAQKSLQEYERALNTARETADRNALQAERAQTSLDVERKENEVLRARITESVVDVESKQTAFIEARKVADSLAQDCADYRHQAETAQKDSDELRKALATAQTQNNAMKAEMMSLHEDIRTFKTQSEFNIISREDELTALHQQVDHLKKQLEIKDDIVRNAARDVTELRKIRTAQDLERERLEAQVETQAFQLEETTSELLKTKQDVTDFDRRYRDVATALNVAQSRRMSSEPAETPDIQPAPTGQMEYRPDLTADDLRPATPDEYDGMSEDDVEDRIMDFRLGLRKDIT